MLWLCVIVAPYSYDANGSLANVVYSDDTPSIAYAYDNRGNVISATVAGVATNLYAYDALGRLSGVVADIGGAPRVFAYSRLPGTDLVSGYGSDGFSRVVAYEPLRPLVSAVTNVFGSTRISTFGYANDAAGRRTAIARGGPAMGALAGATDAYGYDERSQVVSARRSLEGDPVSGFAFDYAYDPIGNRTSATKYDESGAPLASTYTANALNQYTSRTVPGFAAVRGEADTNAFVTVNERPVSRTGVFFHGGDYADNTLSNLYHDLEIYAAINPPGTNTPDTVYAVTTSVFVAKTPETFTYDADGNMTSDGRFTYTWNADNRMVMASNDAVVVTYAYDHRGRMVRKDIDHRGTETQSIFYTWDDWNIIREQFVIRNSSFVIHNVWGLDLDGTLQGAGGVGGLLAVVRDDGVFLPAYDANGNITEYVTTNGEVVAHYDYSSFGETLVASGPLAATFSHQFSTKPWCADTGLNEYQMRKYAPRIGRWMSRDPIWEIDGENLFSYSENDPINEYDLLGLKKCYRWMLITFYSGQPAKIGRASYQKSDLTENDAAVGLTNWTNINGNVSKVRNANGPSDWAYPVYTKFIVHRLTKSGKKTDARIVRDSGKGWAKPRKNLQGGVAVDEWLDLWMKNQTKATNLGTEIDLVEYEIGDDCDCPEGWSEDKFLPIPEKLQKNISGGENTGVEVNYPTWRTAHDSHSVE